MRISQVKAETKQLPVPFADGVELQVTYRPSAYTPSQLDAMAERAAAAQAGNTAMGGKPGEQLLEQARTLIVAWDLETDDGQPVILDYPTRYPDGGAKEYPQGDPLAHVPAYIFLAVTRAIGADQSASAEGKD